MRVFKIHCSQIGKIMGNAKKEGDLSVTCTSYLKEWYANDGEQVYSKYLQKGNMVEQELIDFMAHLLAIGEVFKNENTRDDDYFKGTCDVVLADMIIDVKAAWNTKTLYDKLEGIEKDYEWQLRGYMRLWDRSKSILFYGLMDTPEEVNYGTEVIYSDRPDNMRWVAYSVARDIEKEQEIIDRVIRCREWLVEYDNQVTSLMGRIL